MQGARNSNADASRDTSGYRATHPISLMVSLSNHAQQHCHPADQHPQTRIIVAVYPHPQNLSLFYPRPFHGELLPEPFEVGRGSAPPMAGNGPAVRGSSVQGFPCRYYDWRVLDEHFERGFRQRAKQFTQSRGLPSGTDGIKKRRTGGLRIAFYSTKTRFDDRPSSQQCKQWPDSEMRAWQGESTPCSLKS